MAHGHDRALTHLQVDNIALSVVAIVDLLGPLLSQLQHSDFICEFRILIGDILDQLHCAVDFIVLLASGHSQATGRPVTALVVNIGCVCLEP